MTVSVQIDFDNPDGWRALVPIPFYTTKGLWFWQRWNEANWRPQCPHCKQIFAKDRDEYDVHYMIYVAKWPSNFMDGSWREIVRPTQ